MTLGGLALAVGILVDDRDGGNPKTSTGPAMGKETVQAILDGAQQIGYRRSFDAVHLHCVLPMFLSFGRGEISVSLPLAEAVIFADAGFLHVVAHNCADEAMYLLSAEDEVSGRPARGREDGILSAATHSR